MEQGSNPKIYCRLCAELKDTRKLMDLQELLPNLMRLNQPFIALNDTSLPQKVCLVCVINLDVCVQFIDSLEEAQRALINISPNNSTDDDSPKASESLVTDEWSSYYLKDHGKEETEVSSEKPQNKNLDDCVPLIDSQRESQSALINNTSYDHVDDDSRESLVTDKWTSYYLQDHDKEETVVSGETPRNISSNTVSNSIKSPSEPKTSKLNKSHFDSSSDDANDQYDEEPSCFETVQSWDALHWKCSLCDLILPSRTQLVEHAMATHSHCTAYKCPDCAKKFMTLETYLFHVRNHSINLKTSCHICFKVFNSLRFRVIHQKTHLPDPFTCFGCGSSFPSEEELDIHIATYFQDGRTIQYIEKRGKLKFEPICNICNKTFESKTKLKKHIASNHRPKQVSVCDQCGKSFANKTNLRHHMLLHYHIKDNKCSLCPATFRTKSHLKAHLMRHKGEKNLTCPTCGKSFMFRNQLKTHEAIHSDKFPFQCEFCDKSFKLKGHLKKHSLQHIGLKPYKCQVCEREFRDWANYNKHMVRKHNTDMSKTKRTPQGVIRLAHLTGEMAEAFAKNRNVAANIEPELKTK